MEFKLSQEQYEALIALARRGVKNDAGQINAELAIQLDAFLREVEKQNNVTRYAVWLQWQEIGEPLQEGARFPAVWPPTRRILIEHIVRPITRADLDQVLRENTKNPTSVLWTKDPGATYGWATLDKYT